MATRYTAACLLRSKCSEEYIKALERFWIAHFGVPGQLLTDEGRPWLSGIMDEWTTAHGLQHRVARGEAHERLAIVERRHALIRKAVEIYLDDVKVDHVEGIKEARGPHLRCATARCHSDGCWIQPISMGSWVSTQPCR